MRKLKINFDLFVNLSLEVMLPNSEKEWYAARRETDVPLDDEKESLCAMYWSNGDDGSQKMWIIALTSHLLRDTLCDCLAHEISHAVFHIEEVYGIKDNEFRAYLTGYIHRKVFGWLGMEPALRKKLIHKHKKQVAK